LERSTSAGGVYCLGSTLTSFLSGADTVASVGVEGVKVGHTSGCWVLDAGATGIAPY
jgi:hypothetical protein